MKPERSRALDDDDDDDDDDDEAALHCKTLNTISRLKQ